MNAVESQPLQTHRGEPLPPGRVLVPAPPEIGRVLSAFSTVEEGERAPSVFIRAMGTLFWTLVGAGIGAIVGLLAAVGLLFLLELVMTISAGLHLAIVTSIPSLFAAVMGIGMLFHQWQESRVAKYMTYVGEEGVARIPYGDPEVVAAKTEILRFSDAKGGLEVTHGTHSPVSIGDAYANSPDATDRAMVGHRGDRKETSYRYRWLRDESKREIAFEIAESGKDPFVAGIDKGQDLGFARAAHAAWIHYQQRSG